MNCNELQIIIVFQKLNYKANCKSPYFLVVHQQHEYKKAKLTCDFSCPWYLYEFKIKFTIDINNDELLKNHIKTFILKNKIKNSWSSLDVPFADSFGLVWTSFPGLLFSPLCSQLRPSVRPSVRRRCFGGRRKGRERKSEQAEGLGLCCAVLRWVGLHAKENRQVARMSGSEQAQNSVKVETESAPQAVASSSSSCRKKKSESTTFFSDVLDHIDEFVHASMEEHKSCLKKTLNKVMSAVCLSVCLCLCVCVL
jgi:gas vesicle protein